MHRIIEMAVGLNVYCLICRPKPTLILEMADLKLRVINDLVAHFFNAKREIQVLAVHKKIFIKAMYFYKDILFYQIKGAAWRVDFMTYRKIKICEVITAKKLI